MRKWVGWGLVTLIVLSVIVWPVSTANADGRKTIHDLGRDEPNHVRLVVRYNDTVPQVTTQRLNAAIGGRVVTSIPALNAVVLEIPAERVTAVLQWLRSDPDVLYAEIDARAEIAFTPNDPEYNVRQYGPKIIRANDAWDITTGDPNILVAVVDTGVDYTHPDLTGKVVLGYDFVNNDPDPMDDNGHGTHVAGIVAAATNNGIGVASVGFDTRVLAVKVLDANGSGFYSTVAQGITYAADNGARIINLSLRGTVSSSILQDAVNYAWSKGALVVAAAGNDGSNAPVYPAAYPHVLAVAATDWNDERWGLSNYGDYVDVAAPGVGIYSTDWAGGVGPYASRSGTSMAAPHVAAVAALVLSVDPGLSNDELAALLTSTADDKGDPGWDPYYGAGRINAYAAVVAAQGQIRDVQTGSIGDFVWMDANGNGLQDPDEPGIAQVRVELYQADGTLLATTTTGPNGEYTFEGVPTGDYFVRVASPAGYVFTLTNQGGDDTLDSDVDRATGRTPIFTLAAGESATHWDAGLIPTVRLGGVTWVDPNANGIRDTEETHVVPGVPVRITGTDITGINVDITLYTDDTGQYYLDNLLPGTYQIQVPASIEGYVLTSSSVVTVTLTAQNRTMLDVNFGYIAPTNVDLMSFDAIPTARRVRLEWRVRLMDTSIPFFHVWRATPDGQWQRLTDTPLLPVEENGRIARFLYEDEEVTSGQTYIYRLESVGGATFGPWRVRVPNALESHNSSVTFLPLVTH